MITPADLELPEKFPDWRPNQFEMAARISGSPSYSYLLDAPTGTGKSLIGATVQRLTEHKVIYLCTTKQLQDQLLNDFPYAKTLKGKNNYPCTIHQKDFPTITAEDCTHTKDRPCKVRNTCPYVVAKKAALSAPLAILNTSYYLHEANYIGGFSDRELIIVDELDTLEGQLMNFIEVAVTKRQLDSMDIAPPRYKTKFEAWVEWADSAIAQLTRQHLEVSKRLNDSWSTIDFKDIRLERRLSRLLAKLRFFVKEVDQNWVWYPGEDRWSFKPVWIAKYASTYMWNHTKRVVGMSATILNPYQVRANVGLVERTSDYKMLPSPFPKENRPVYYEPCAAVTNKTMDIALPKLAKAVERIMDKHPNDKILCVAEGTLVRTATGYRSIEHVIAGDKVLTHKGRFRTVSNVYKREINEIMLKVKPVGSSAFLITQDHPVAVLDSGVLNWKTPTSLGSSHLFTPTIVEKLAGIGLPAIRLGPKAVMAQIDTGCPEFWYCVGAWAAEGFLGSSGQVKWASVLLPYSFKIIDAIQKAGFHAWYNRSTKCVISSCKELSSWLESEVCRGAHSKRVPSYLFSSNAQKRQIDAFVEGYLDGDGCTKDPSTKNKWVSVSAQLVLGVRDLLRKDYMPTIFVDKHGWWYGSINRVRKHGPMRGNNWTSVRSVEKVPYTGSVYNLKVEEDESYCLDLVCVHNCHTVSYRVKNYLINHLPTGRIVTHAAADRAIVLEAYKRSDKPLVLLSPSMDRGVDLPDDQCRVVVIAKVPYPDLGDPQVNKRVYASKDGNRWYAHKTVSSIVQMAGRGVRSDTDYAVTYILDEQFGRVYNENRSMFPAWFKQAVVM